MVLPKPATVRPDGRLDAWCQPGVARAISVRVTIRHAVLPLGAVLVLGLGVYLFVEVRAQPAPVQAVRTPRTPRPAAPEPAPAAVPDLPPGPPVSPALPPPAARPQAPVIPDRHDVAGGPAPEPDPALAGPKLDAVMDEANKAYDRGDFEDAKTIAGRLLAKLPTNTRMLRIMVSASCIDGDTAVAQAHYMKLPPTDQEQMKVRCARYGITFPDKP
jgi:hypothetical protein